MSSRVNLIWAMAEGGVIGKDGDLPWHLPADLKHFKKVTLGHTLIMGRRTWESIGGVLPGRRAIVVSRQAEYEAPGAEVAASVAAAVELAREAGEEEIFVAGGTGVFRDGLPLADRLVLTRIHGRVEGDTFFPPWDESAWRVVEERHHPADERHAFALTFQTLERR